MGALRKLHRLIADNNMLTSIPGVASQYVLPYSLSFSPPLSPAVKPPHANARVPMRCGLGSALVLWYAGEIRHCSQLRELSLEANRLSAPVIDLRSLAHLRSLQLFGNPLDFLPELTPCSSLRHLSLANVSRPC